MRHMAVSVTVSQHQLREALALKPLQGYYNSGKKYAV